MVYLIFGNQSTTLKKRINAIVKEKLQHKDEMNFVRYDGANVLIQECIDDANYLALGYDHKIVVIDNCYFLTKPKPKNKIESEQDYSLLEKFIKNQNDECDLILTLSSSSIDKTSKLYKLISEYGKIIEIVDPTIDEWNGYVKKYCYEVKKMNIDFDALIELGDRTTGDVALFQNNVDKLLLYKEHISLNDVKLLVSRPLEEDTFLMFNYLLNSKKDLAIKLFRDFRVSNIEPITIISILASQFRLLNRVLFLFNKGYDINSIAKELSINHFRVQYLLRDSYKMKGIKFEDIFEDLYQLDLQIKSGLIDRDYGFEMFLINF